MSAPQVRSLQKERIENIQGLRGVAILLVLLFHLGVYEGRMAPGTKSLAQFTDFGQYGVDLFFVMSGFVMVTITKVEYHEPAAAVDFLLRRIVRIYPLYWFYSLVCLPFLLFFPALINRPEGTQSISLFRSFLLLPNHEAPLVGQGWTLVHEMYFYLMFALTFLRPARDRILLLSIWGAIILGYSVFTNFVAPPSAMLALVLNPLTLEFLSGCAIAYAINAGIKKLWCSAIILGSLGFVLAALLHPNWNRVALYLPVASLITYGTVAAEKSHRHLLPRWVRFVGDISYSLYLSHIFVLSAVKWIIVNHHPRSFPPSGILFCLCGAAASLSFGAASYYWLEKPLLKLSYSLASKLYSLAARPSRRQTKVG